MDQLQLLLLLAVIATATELAWAAPVQSEPGSVQFGIDDKDDDLADVKERDGEEEGDEEEKSQEDQVNAGEKKLRRGSRTVRLCVYAARRHCSITEADFGMFSMFGQTQALQTRTPTGQGMSTFSTQDRSGDHNY